MAPPIELLRERIGLVPGDASRDAQLAAAWGQAIALCETYCDRKLEKATDTEELWPARGSLLVRRYPIESVTSITDASGTVLESSAYQVIDLAGIIVRAGAMMGGGGAPLEVVYVGGYEPLPKDLEFAVLAAFDAVWAATPGWGAVSGAQSVGAVQKISIVGVGSLDLADSASSAASAGAGGQIGAQPWGILPISATSILSRYMNHTVIAGG